MDNIKNFIRDVCEEYRRNGYFAVTCVDVLIELDKKGIRRLNNEVRDFLRSFSSSGIKLGDTVISPLLKRWQKIYENTNPSVDDFINFLNQNSSIFKVLKIYFGVEDVKEFLFIKDRGDKKDSVDQKDRKDDRVFDLLRNYGRNLTALAKEGKLSKVVGRDDEIQRLVQVLLRKTKNSPVLIGEAGVGKTAIVEGLAQKIANGQIPELVGVSVFEITTSSLLAGTSLRGELEKKLDELIKALEGRNDIILFIDELHTIMFDNTISNVMKPALARGQIRMIGATTTEEYYKYIEKDPALERRFQTIMVQEPTFDEMLFILENVIDGFEAFHKVKYDRSMFSRLIKLSQRYLPHRNLPDKVIDIIDEAATYVKTERKKDVVELDDIKEVISRQANVPVSKMKDEEIEKIANLEELLKSKVIGQDEAIERVCKVIKISRVGLASSKRPYGVFLFLGPTGVGKTYLAKVLAETLFDSEDSLIRLDMSEFKEKHEVAKLLGAPPGYVGFDRDGILTLAIKKSPYSILLLDEIEKAHPEVFDIFLQVFDEGHLKDSKGRTLTFYDTVIIMTSNIGSSLIFQLLSSNPSISSEELKKAVLPEVLKFLRPEIVNRIDDIIVFRPLSRENIERIVDLELEAIAVKVRENGDDIRFTDSLKEYVMSKGFDIAFGARNIKRVIQGEVLAKIADALISKMAVKNKFIVVDYDGEVLVRIED